MCAQRPEGIGIWLAQLSESTCPKHTADGETGYSYIYRCVLETKTRRFEPYYDRSENCTGTYHLGKVK